MKKSVSALRQILGEAATESLYIKTVPRRGYSFVAPVRGLADEDSGIFYLKSTTEDISIEEINSAEISTDHNPINLLEPELIAKPEPTTFQHARKIQILTIGAGLI